MRDIIKCIDHGVYGVSTNDIPCCPCCGQPMWVGEPLTLQTCDAGPGHPDLVRLIHSSCSDWADEEDDDE